MYVERVEARNASAHVARVCVILLGVGSIGSMHSNANRMAHTDGTHPDERTRAMQNRVQRGGVFSRLGMSGGGVVRRSVCLVCLGLCDARRVSRGRKQEARCGL